MTQFRGIDPISDDNWLMTKVKQNPEAFLVLAAGCALLLRAGGSRSRGSNPRSERLERPEPLGRHARSDDRRSAQCCGRPPGSRQGHRCRSLRKGFGLRRVPVRPCQRNLRTSGRLRVCLSDQASDWGRSVADETARMSARARSSMQDGLGRMVKEQPFAVAALGIAVGAAVAAFLPPTQAEQDALRPFGEAAANAVNSGVNQIKDAVSATGDQLKDAAQRRGLNAEGIKDMAREATQTFTDKLGGSTAHETPAASPRPGVSM